MKGGIKHGGRAHCDAGHPRLPNGGAQVVIIPHQAPATKPDPAVPGPLPSPILSSLKFFPTAPNKPRSDSGPIPDTHSAPSRPYRQATPDRRRSGGHAQPVARADRPIGHRQGQHRNQRAGGARPPEAPALRHHPLRLPSGRKHGWPADAGIPPRPPTRQSRDALHHGHRGEGLRGRGDRSRKPARRLSAEAVHGRSPSAANRSPAGEEGAPGGHRPIAGSRALVGHRGRLR